MSDFQWRGLQARARQIMGFTPTSGVLGDDNDPSRLFDPLIDGNVWVRPLYSNGYGKAISVRGPLGTSIKLKPGMPVKLVWTEDRRLEVRTYDAPGGTQSGTNLLGANLPTLDSGGFIGQQSLVTALVTPQQTPDLTVVIKAWLVVVSGTLYVFPGSVAGGIDLSTFVPSAGNNRYVVVFIDSDFLSTRVTASTTRSTGDLPLGADDIQECLTLAPTSSIPLAVVRLYGGQTQIRNGDIKHDLRQVINTAGQNDAVSYSNILTDNNGDVLSDNNGDVLFT